VIWRVLAGAAAAAAAITAAACSSSSSPVPHAPASSASASVSVFPFMPAGPGPCQAPQLSVRRAASQGTAGPLFTQIEFRNISPDACSIYGYPGVSFTDGAGTQIGVPAVRNILAQALPVILAPGRTAAAQLEIGFASAYPAAQCGLTTARRLKIYPPGLTAPFYLPYTVQTCSKPVQILTISAVRAGQE
jgi:Domain of unknown function (DUF4232)